MKYKIIIGAFLVAIIPALFSSCSSTSDTLYSWNNYEAVSYKYSKDPSEKNLLELQKCFEKITSQPSGQRKVVPPGILAEYAYFLYKQGKKEQAIEMMNREIEAYPESKEFIDKIINQLEK